MKVEFFGYVEVDPQHYQPEFVVTGSDKLPDGAQVTADTLRALGIPFRLDQDYFQWRRAQYARRLAIAKYLRSL